MQNKELRNFGTMENCMGIIKDILKRVKYGCRASSKSYISYLRSKGVEIGEGTVFYAPQSAVIDETRPYMITIGKNVHFTNNITILTHDFGWGVIKGISGEVLGSCAPVVIGDNVFIGANTTILKGVTIGENVVIGANSLLCKDVPPNCVVAGNPLRVCSSIDAYREKYEARQLEEACSLYRCYKSRNQEGDVPVEVFREFFWLFDDGTLCSSNKAFSNVMDLVWDTREKSETLFMETRKQRPFSDYKEFCAYCEKEMAELN